ncbi:MAG: sulfite exporter TauE/SafE family protein [Sphingomonadaceae bacterium]|nr:sulfite exporter TauE/SafE family protein [Sphingomonadaceae bacterium]
MAPTPHELSLALAMGVAAALYSTVGHAGASAYIGLMALWGIAPPTMKPTALVLNLIVASMGSVRYVRAGLFRWRTLWPFLVGALPFAFIGGGIQLPAHWYRPLIGGVLILSAVRLLWPHPIRAALDPCDPPIVLGVGLGAGLGLLAGLTGTGGGIFLSPLLLFLGWSDTKRTVGVASLFIMANSTAGLLGNLSAATASLPSALPLYAGAVLIGGVGGTTVAIRSGPAIILKALGVVLAVAGAKLIATR